MLSYVQSILQSGTTQLSGVEYGLSLLLFVGAAGRLKNSEQKGQLNLIPGLTESDPALVSGQGARVVVHSPQTLPLPTTDGYDVPSGFSVTIGVKARENVRIKEPHGSCKNAKTNSTYDYTLISCQLKCIQYSIMYECNCTDNRLPEVEWEGPRPPFCLELPILPSECAFTDNDDASRQSNHTDCVRIASQLSQRLACRKRIYDLVTVVQPGNMAVCGCYPPCNDIVYDVGYSLSSLPDPTGEHSDFYSKINSFLQHDLPEPKRALYQKLNVTSNSLISRLNVFIADCNIIKTTESPDYELIRLISDIGGQLGLWIGISVITLVEVVQLAGDILRKLAGSGIRGVHSVIDDDNAANRKDHGNQRTKYHQPAEDSDDARHWPSCRRLQTENGSVSSLPVDEMTSSV